MAIGLIIIGDEILSGRRVDQHFPKVVQMLAARGLQLGWAEILPDDPQRITATLRRTFASDDIVFCCGGIGATPDDHTRQCVAAAAGVGLRLHPEAEREIRGRFGAETTPHRLRMGEFPEGSSIIPNPVNRIPGFSLHEHHFVPGFPQMAQPMVEWVLDTRYAHLLNRDRWAEQSILVYEAGESQLIFAMKDVEAGFQGVKVFSLPSVDDATHGRHIELGVKGAVEHVDAAYAQLLQSLHDFGARLGPELVR